MGSMPAKPFNQNVADEILERISSTSLSLAKILKEKDEYPKVTTFFKWLNANKEFAKDYARAKECQAEYMAEEILTISDESGQDVLFVDEWGNKVKNKEFVERAKLRIDVRKWYTSKILPKKYGDKIEVQQETKHSYSDDTLRIIQDRLNANAIKDDTKAG